MVIRAALAAIASLVFSPLAPGPVDATTPGAVPDRVTIQGATPEWTRRIEWGVGRFRQAGLRLPAIVINVHDDKVGCNGNSGLFRTGDPGTVDLCVTSDADSGVAKLTTLHELVHAWAETHLTAAEKGSFLALRELTAWADPRVPRHEWGAEHAAEVVSWGLMEEASPIIRIHDAAPAQLAIAFDELVGAPPLWSR